MVPPANDWTGFYLGAGGGYGFWSADSQVLAPGGGCIVCQKQTPSGRGYYGTAGGGFDYQFSVNLLGWNPQIVAGLLGDYTFADFKGTLPDGAVTAFTPSGGTLKETSAWAGGARIGLLALPSVLTYSTFGATGTHFGGVSFASQATGLANGQFSSGFNKIGWFTGGGFESPLDLSFLPKGLFLRTDYRYSYFGTQNINTTGTVAHIITFKPAVQTLSTELVYRFNWH